jgi:hypothetical protein
MDAEHSPERLITDTKPVLGFIEKDPSSVVKGYLIDK